MNLSGKKSVFIDEIDFKPQETEVRLLNDINTVLNLFSKVNEVKSYGVSYVYKFSKICPCDPNNIESSAKYHLGKVSYCSDISIKLKPIHNWEDRLFTENELFKHHNPKSISSEDYWLGIVPNEIRLNKLTPKEFIVKILKDYFSPNNMEVFSMSVHSSGYYACSWEEYLFYNKKTAELYWLSFQVHD